MKIKELKNKSESDLKKLLSDLREESRSVRFELSYGRISNVAKIKKLKQDIARILTLLNNINKSEKNK